VAPFETFSNLGYLVLAILALRKRRKWENLWGLSLLGVGVFSGLFHASHTYTFELWDLHSMNVLLGLAIVLALKRGGMGTKGAIAAGIALGLSASGIVAITADSDRLYGATLMVAILIGMILSSAELRRRPYRELLAMFSLAALAHVSWMLDYARIWTYGHSAWHLLTAGALWFLGRKLLPDAGVQRELETKSLD
jgi:hypothetical protein